MKLFWSLSVNGLIKYGIPIKTRRYFLKIPVFNGFQQALFKEKNIDKDTYGLCFTIFRTFSASSLFCGSCLKKKFKSEIPPFLRLLICLRSNPENNIPPEGLFSIPIFIKTHNLKTLKAISARKANQVLEIL